MKWKVKKGKVYSNCLVEQIEDIYQSKHHFFCFFVLFVLLVLYKDLHQLLDS